MTTGQDAIYAKELIFYKEMMENYPGLLETLLDPYGSLYLDGEMYETVFQFLDDCLACHSGEIPLKFIYDGAEEIRTNPVKRWLEEHRKFTDELVDGMRQAVCAAILLSAIRTTAPIEGRLLVRFSRQEWAGQGCRQQ